MCVSLTTLGSAYTQDFDTLSNTAGSMTNNLTITGWAMTEAGGGARDNEQYGVDTGGVDTGDVYSYGAASSTERALGTLQSGALIPIIGACFTNNTGTTVTSLAIAYTGEEWRLGAAARTDRLDFEYSTDATSLTAGTWTAVNALDFVTPNTAAPTGPKDGNNASFRTALSSTIPALSIANGATIWIRWLDANPSGNDDGLAVDDFSLTPNSVPPVTLSINDVSLDQGNAGTTMFTFTVSLSAPAGPGGVTFDIATADGTAQDDNPAAEDNDYVAQTLTSQTITSGTSTYTFNVTVNGAAAVEANETFFVNVTNVTSANVGDGQGQGTIQNDDVAGALSFTSANVRRPLVYRFHGADLEGSMQMAPDDSGIIVTTTPNIEGMRITRYLGIVSGEAILGANIFRDFFAGIRDIVGGRSGAYEEQLRDAKQIAMQEMTAQARQRGANAVVAVDLDYETITMGNSGGMLMVTAAGTAVYFER